MAFQLTPEHYELYRTYPPEHRAIMDQYIMQSYGPQGLQQFKQNFQAYDQQKSALPSENEKALGKAGALIVGPAATIGGKKLAEKGLDKAASLFSGKGAEAATETATNALTSNLSQNAAQQGAFNSAADAAFASEIADATSGGLAQTAAENAAFNQGATNASRLAGAANLLKGAAGAAGVIGGGIGMHNAYQEQDPGMGALSGATAGLGAAGLGSSLGLAFVPGIGWLAGGGALLGGALGLMGHKSTKERQAEREAALAAKDPTFKRFLDVGSMEGHDERVKSLQDFAASQVEGPYKGFVTVKDNAGDEHQVWVNTVAPTEGVQHNEEYFNTLGGGDVMGMPWFYENIEGFGNLDPITQAKIADAALKSGTAHGSSGHINFRMSPELQAQIDAARSEDYQPGFQIMQSAEQFDRSSVPAWASMPSTSGQTFQRQLPAPVQQPGLAAPMIGTIDPNSDLGKRANEFANENMQQLKPASLEAQRVAELLRRRA